MIHDVHSPAKMRCMHFDASHGGNAVQVVHGWLFFADGARRETNTMGALMEPPDDPFERAMLVEAYHKKRMDLAIAAFDQFKTELMKDKSTRSLDDLSRLKELQATALAMKANWEAAVSEREKVDPRHPKERTPEQIVSDESQRTWIEQFRKQVQAVEV